MWTENLSHIERSVAYWVALCIHNAFSSGKGFEAKCKRVVENRG